ncbi:MAG: succinate dehydrogenase assembly factor 2 [Novosphingobium sp.]|mgnify:FL=1|uniref:succinate dehydrogenase assembly factor 2 n=1 Tax=Novosphingobium sp. TaxID=1874826 RepID=UPI00262208C7|nr:succinate dehydrogenase assembly factor 2 [Novosphingobium sp.]MCP5386935.1 succinate dehydrogenase assembly factor 2 [Novosphingobium sp.]
MEPAHRLRRLKFRAWHRGTREADYMIGCFFDRYGESWDKAEIAWFERLLDEEDADIMGWALGSLAIPSEYAGAQMDAFRKLDFVEIPR